MPSITYSVGIVEGPKSNETLVCQFAQMVNSQGCIWFGGNPFAFTFPRALLQIIAIFLSTNAVWFLIRPLKQSLVSAQLIAGIIMGPSLLGHIYGTTQKLFPLQGRLILETIASLGFMLHLFTLGVQINMSMVLKIKRNATVIGATSFFLPIAIAALIKFIVTRATYIDANIKKSISLVSFMNIGSSFPVITCLLSDLNILNSNIGRIATSSALVCEICSWVLRFAYDTIAAGGTNGMIWASLGFFLTNGVLFSVFFFVFRPIAVHISRRVTRDGHLSEVQFIVIMLIAFSCGLCGQILGHPPGFIMFVLGLFIPNGSQMGSSIISKIDLVIDGLFLPVKLVGSGLKVEISTLRGFSGAIIGLAMFGSYLTKFFSCLLPAVYYEIPFKDAVSLSLIMCCRGVIEAVWYCVILEKEMITNQQYSILLISMLLVTGIARPLISRLYDPSAQYSSTHRKAIMYNHPNDEVRMLVCVHNEGNVSPVMKLLQISNPTKNKSMRAVVLNLLELQGRAAPVLKPTHQTRKLNSVRSWPNKVPNAFNNFAQRIYGDISFCYVTSISPYASMHDDICSLASEKKTDIVIIPFHKQRDVDGEGAAVNPGIRIVNQNVLMKAPCSVGVLIDRGQIEGGRVLLTSQHTMLHVYVLFLGGNDDCEALAYSMCFMDNPQINLTLLWIRPLDEEGSAMEESLDMEMVDQFKARALGNKRVSCKEELVSDSIETTKVITTIEGRCDLCIVGRHHDPSSKILLGFMGWSEYPELGVLGDLLVNSHSQFSVLVMQYQPPTTSLVDNNDFDLESVSLSSTLRSNDCRSHTQLVQSKSQHSMRSYY